MKLTEAIEFAAKCHEGQLRKGTNIPYMVHPMEACAIAATITSDPEVLAAAVLHDVAEDCGVTIKELQDRFGYRVAALVAAESELKEDDAEGSWQRRKQHTIDKLQDACGDELILTMADKLSNIRAICRDYEKLGDGLWKRFNQQDMKMQAWYYKSIRDKLVKLSDSAAFTEYSELVDRVFTPGD
jgi:myo-inositol-1(or 4)-monophosphatase